MRETEGLIQAGLNSTPEKEYQTISQRTNDSRGLLNQGDNLNQGLNYGDEALSSAIRSKYSKPYNTQMSGMENKMRLDARNAHFARLQTAHQLANEEAKINFQKEMIKYKQKMAKRQQRQQLVGSVLGLTGAVAGGVIGGSAGAAGGSMAGGAAGQALTQSQE